MTTLPTIHLNGTGAESLFYEYNNAWRALKAARAALAETTCNARDFYPQGDGIWQDARFERAEALSNLDDVISFVEAWVEHTNNNH